MSEQRDKHGERAKPVAVQPVLHPTAAAPLHGDHGHEGENPAKPVSITNPRRVAKASTKTWFQKLANSPTRLITASFAFVIAVGTLLLMLPMAKEGPGGAPLLTALFTATSSTCVTGLILVDTATYWTHFGQVVILTLIQIGGLGLVTLSSFFFIVSRRKMGMKTLLAMQESTSSDSMMDSKSLVIRIILITVGFEAAGTAILTWRFSRVYDGSEVLFQGMFHAISAFCNAGFDLSGRRFGKFVSLTPYNNDPIVLLTCAFLLIFGGVGFLVWANLFSRKDKKNNRFHSRLVWLLTGGILLTSTLLFLALEWHNTRSPSSLGSLPVAQRPVAAFFQAATLRTGGFNSIDQITLTATSKFLSVVLMFIGAAPGSTAGGIKITTIAVLGASVFSEIKGREYPVLLKRRLRKELVQKALVILCLGLTVVLGVSVLMSVIENHQLAAGKFTFLDLVFEAASAFGTVGITSAGTPNLAHGSHVLLIMAMFLGRVGPISFAMSMSKRAMHEKSVILPEGKIYLG